MSQKLTVIVPIYNGEKYLNQCVDSIINQTYRNLEIILVDNGSTDSSGSICDRYGEQDLRVKVIHRKECGNASVGRNAGLIVATGDWIAFLDADDWLELDFYQEMFNRMLKDSDTIDIMFSGGYYTNCNDGSNRILKYRNVIFDYTEKNEIIGLISEFLDMPTVSNNYASMAFVWNKMYRRKFLKKNHLKFDLNIAVIEDVFFNLIALEKACRVVGTNYIGNHYRIDKASYCHRYIADYDVKYFLINTKQILQKENIYDSLEKNMNNRFVLVILGVMSQRYFNRENSSSYITRKNEFKKLMKEDIFHDAIYGKKNKMLFKYELRVFLLKIHFYFPFELYYRYMK
jgi:glycosyltransferase involved in cell wall biosynthesis